MAEPLIYILILNYRAWRDTVACLGALEKLEYPNYRVLVLDNASDNDSVAQIRAAFPKVEVMELGRNLGYAGGNNVGIRRALTEGAAYVWLLNPDTLPDARALAAMVEQAQQDVQIGAVGSVLYEMDRPEQVQAWGGGEVVLPWGLIRLLNHPGQTPRLNYISGASLLLRREALERVGLLDEGFFMYGEDADMGLRLLKSGFKLAVAPQARVWHKGGTSWHGSLKADEHFAAYNVRLFRKHAPRPGLAVAGYAFFWLVEFSLRGRFDRVGALWRGLRRGWRLPLSV
ncbi:glycosyltransferase family 2 protein [Meiothermus sp.]|uniref:glycosyltransferase family 2 protein n=1 Tax=Meiothermus sp. TaxID=1955249 RepID=UPI0021DDCF0C|nr:glycosyltransferase family 2 protein [Meiothermus sp.]GIW33563.1 MAG: rhamnosyltransferase [Meiothermus sp.]